MTWEELKQPATFPKMTPAPVLGHLKQVTDQSKYLKDYIIWGEGHYVLSVWYMCYVFLCNRRHYSALSLFPAAACGFAWEAFR